MPVYQLDERLIFPDPELAEEDGLLAVGGDLSRDRLLLAYQNGIFPWYSEDDPILWWSPDPRMVLFPEELKISKSMKQVLKKQEFGVTINKDFTAIIEACAKQPRKDQEGTWITDEMKMAYIQLHQEGWAHSVEVWQDEQLVGGLYGVLMGKCFYGESMFATVSNASKVGFIHFVEYLTQNGVKIIDCQVHTPHLESLGARMIPRKQYLAYQK